MHIIDKQYRFAHYVNYNIYNFILLKIVKN